MTAQGIIRDGAIVLDTRLDLPEGVRVSVSVSPQVSENQSSVSPSEQTLGQRLMKFAGRAKGLPADGAIQHDHYIYGVPKK